MAIRREWYHQRIRSISSVECQDLNRDLTSQLSPDIVTNANGFGFKLGSIIVNCLNVKAQNNWNTKWKLPIPYSSKDTYSMAVSMVYSTSTAISAAKLSNAEVEVGSNQVASIGIICIGY